MEVLSERSYRPSWTVPEEQRRASDSEQSSTAATSRSWSASRFSSEFVARRLQPAPANADHPHGARTAETHETDGNSNNRIFADEFASSMQVAREGLLRSRILAWTLACIATCMHACMLVVPEQACSTGDKQTECCLAGWLANRARWAPKVTRSDIRSDTSSRPG